MKKKGQLKIELIIGYIKGSKAECLSILNTEEIVFSIEEKCFLFRLTGIKSSFCFTRFVLGCYTCIIHRNTKVYLRDIWIHKENHQWGSIWLISPKTPKPQQNSRHDNSPTIMRKFYYFMLNVRTMLLQSGKNAKASSPTCYRAWLEWRWSCCCNGSKRPFAMETKNNGRCKTFKFLSGFNFLE